MFVIANPIGSHFIHHFETAQDQVNLIGFEGFENFEAVRAALGEDEAGNAVLALGNGSSITVYGVRAADLRAENFVYNVEPVLNQGGTMTLANGSMLPLSGTINNTGTIALESTGSDTLLQMIQHGVKFQGGGEIRMSDSDGNVIAGSVSDVTLTNVDNTISGAGRIGDGQMTLVNHGSIAATGSSHALVIDTGANAIVNTGLFAALGTAGLVVASAVSGHGSALIAYGAQLGFAAASDANVDFASGGAGTLVLGRAAEFGGTITGLLGGDAIRIADVAFSGTLPQFGYAASAAGSSGTLRVGEGSEAVQFTLVGRYTADDFRVERGEDGSLRLVSTASYNGTVLGGFGADTVVGTSGDDIVVGGKGADFLTGGAGSDTFLYRLGDWDAVDTITDFQVGAGGDVLAVGALLQGWSVGSDLSQFISLREQEGSTVVSIDADGAQGTAAFRDLVVLQGVTGLDLDALLAQVDANPLG
ncbi:type I secretion C-terminal target domain-containing protein [Caldimonas tepidiphila]|uniref:type I secretion C-terminal target domain-containing protein n=1 Tax=Caldimonas tepidiphila TaxID=2315841 RepID=UPI000E5BA862|nr:type I secretion C-terminal target domain-containing protein [Caldimonas tepidiphila]